MAEKKILVVDDDPGIVTLVSAMLKREGYAPVQAYGGKEALLRYQESAPDLILLDLAMPGMNGYEVVDAIRNLEKGTRHTPIILLTAHLHSYFDSSGPHPGIDGYITKPVTARKLREDLEKLLSS